MSATPRDIRRLAFQVLYQMDARGGDDSTEVASIGEEDERGPRFTPAEQKKAYELARAAYEGREAADTFMTEAAPGWPAHRQAAVDRAILRLAHHEMVSGKTHPKIAVNEAVELAKAYSTDKSPAFINGLLDRLLKKVLGQKAAAEESTPVPQDGQNGGASE